MKHIYKKLDKILEEFKKINQTNKFFPNKYDMDYTLSEEMLSQIMINGDLAKANSLDHNDNRIILNNSIFYQIKLKEMLGEETGVKRKYSGFFWYPPDAFCGWHTNNNFHRDVSRGVCINVLLDHENSFTLFSNKVFDDNDSHSSLASKIG